MELLRRLDYKNLIVLLVTIFISLLALVMAVFPAITLAQGDDCVWENINCAPSPTTTPTGTLTPQPTETLEAQNFAAPNFNVPTSIPALQFPTPPPPLEFSPIPAPSPISIELTPLPTPDYSWAITPSATITLSQINTTLTLSYPTPSTINLNAGAVTGTTELTGSIGSAITEYGGFVGNVVSYTNYLTGEIAAMQGTETITVIQAPVWYAPALPRPMAGVGWTFEQLTDPEGEIKNYTLSSWAGFFGYTVTMPFQMVKSLWQLVAYFGPFGLFLGWLLIMFVIVLAIHAQVFIIKFVIVSIRVLVRIAEILGEWIPTGG